MSCWTGGTNLNDLKMPVIYVVKWDNNYIDFGTETSGADFYVSKNYGETWIQCSNTSPDYQVSGFTWNSINIGDINVWHCTDIPISSDQIYLYKFKGNGQYGEVFNNRYSNVVGIGNYNVGMNKIEAKILGYKFVDDEYVISGDNNTYLTGTTDEQNSIYYAVQAGDSSWTELLNNGDDTYTISANTFNYNKDIIIIRKTEYTGNNDRQYAVEVIPAIPTIELPFTNTGNNYTFKWINNSKCYAQFIGIGKNTTDISNFRFFSSDEYVVCDDNLPNDYYFFGIKHPEKIIGNVFYYFPYKETSLDNNYIHLDSNPLSPSGLTTTSVSYRTIDIQWINNGILSNNNVIQIYSGGTWNNFATISSTATTYQLTGLTRGTEYTIRVSNRYNSIDYPSDSITEITLYYPPSFCEQTKSDLLTVSAATCGNYDGTIILKNPDYLQFYDLVIRDSFLNYYYFDTDQNSATYGHSQALFAGWYHIQASPKPEYSDYYDNINCNLLWINVPDSDTSMSLQSVSIKNAICSGFGKRKGRIAYFISGITGHQYDVYLFKQNGEGTDADLIETKNDVIDINPVIFTNLDEGIYYVIVYDQNDDCILNLGSHIVESITEINVAGVSKLYVTKFNFDVEVNYWSEADEDYYLSGIDPNFFNSIKIKEFIDLPDSWYEIPLTNAHATYGQTMNKTTQGFIFTDTITITIPKADNAKWLNLVDFLADKHIVVLVDNNNNVWTMGYKYGAKVDGYKMQDNNYQLTINAKSDNKIMTALDKNYFNRFIK